MNKILIEVRAAEGGDHAKLLVKDQVKIYLNYSKQETL